MAYSTPYGDEMRDLLDTWESACFQEEKNQQISMMLDGQNFIFFFLCHNEVFGTHEQQRVTFARMKQPDKETTDDWLRTANFMAFNLTKALNARPEQQIFYHRDLSDIKILDKDQAYAVLKKQSENKSSQSIENGIKAVSQLLQQNGKDTEDAPVPATERK